MSGLRKTALRLVPVFALVCGLGVAIGAYLDFSALRSAYLEVVRARFAALASQITVNAETSISLRTPLAEQETLLVLVQREQRLDELVLSIDILDPADRVLLSSVPARAGESFATSPDTLLLRNPIRDDIGEIAGYVAIRYDGARVGQAVERLWSDMLGIAVPAALLAMLLGSVLSWLLLRRLAARIEEAGDLARWRGEAARVRDEVLERCVSVAKDLGGARPPGPPAAARHPPRSAQWVAGLLDRRFDLSLAAVVVVILAGALLAVGARMSVTGAQVLVPELGRNAESVARSVGATIERAAGYGVPVERIPGLDVFFGEQLAGNRDLGAVRFTSADGRLIAQAVAAGRRPGAWLDTPTANSATVGPVAASLGVVSVVVPDDVVTAKLSAVWLDQAIVVFVATLITLELLVLAIGRRRLQALTDVEARLARLARGRLELTASPAGASGLGALAGRLDEALSSVARVHDRVSVAAHERGDARATAALRDLRNRTGVGVVLPAADPDLSDAIRPALFLFMLSEELTRPLLPNHVRTFDLAGLGMSTEFATSLPIVVFMVMMALSQPLLGGWSDRVSSRGLFALGAGIGALGHAAAALAPEFWSFVAARGLTAFGYALAFVAAQANTLAHAPVERRARALAMFVRTIMVAALCGPPLGGILGDRFGGEVAFAAAALVAALGAAVSLAVLTRSPTVRSVRGAVPGGPGVLIKSPPLVAVLVGCALPAKIVLAALCFYLIPLHLAGEGYDLAAIGRLQMLYPIVMVLCVPLFAMLADRWNARAAFIVIGCLIAGTAAFYPGVFDAPWAIALMLLQLGVGQALSIAPQSAFVADLGERLTGRSATGLVMGFFRFVERLGNAVGPALAALLLASLGFAGTLGAIGALAICGSLFFLVVLFTSDRMTLRPKPSEGHLTQ